MTPASPTTETAPAKAEYTQKMPPISLTPSMRHLSLSHSHSLSDSHLKLSQSVMSCAAARKLRTMPAKATTRAAALYNLKRLMSVKVERRRATTYLGMDLAICQECFHPSKGDFPRADKAALLTLSHPHVLHRPPRCRRFLSPVARGAPPLFCLLCADPA